MYFVGLTVSKARHGDSPFELLFLALVMHLGHSGKIGW
jgi:hypothetical protein